MKIFFELVKVEYRKLLCKKSVGIFTFGIIIFIFLSANIIDLLSKTSVQDEKGNFLTYYDVYKRDKASIDELNGKKINSELLYEASQNYDLNPTKYYALLEKIHKVYNNDNILLTPTEFKTMNYEDFNMFYEKRIEKINDLLQKQGFSKEEITYILDMDNKVSKPFTFENVYTYNKYMNLTLTIGMLSLFLISLIISPIFSEEYNRNMDSLLLSTKEGKKTLIIAKLFATFSISIIITVSLTLSSLLTLICLYGSNGIMAEIQLIAYYLTYDMTILQCIVIVTITSIFGTMLQATICMAVSSMTRNAIVPTAIAFLSISLCLFNVEGNPFLTKIFSFSPVQMSNFDYVMKPIVFNFFGSEIILYKAVCIVATFLIIGLSFFSIKRFKNYQIMS
ncbi:MAG: hypothetical protein ACK5LY_00340 [Lachnospirales bacterium]